MAQRWRRARRRRADGILRRAHPARDGTPRRGKADSQQGFLSFVSPELKNPLASIKGLAQLMRSRGAYDEAAFDALLGQACRLERLLNDLVDATPRPVCPGLAALVANAAAEAQAVTARHTVSADIPDQPVIGTWDAERIGEVLQNLFANDIKYAPDDTEMVARLERCDGRGVRVSVVDEGSEIAPELPPRLFERFYRAPSVAAPETPGLGLGLYVSRVLVEAHRGRIWAEPVGHATGFRITLPAVQPVEGRF